MYTLNTFEKKFCSVCNPQMCLADWMEKKMGRSDGTEQQNIQKILDIPQSSKKIDILQEKVCTNERLH